MNSEGDSQIHEKGYVKAEELKPAIEMMNEENFNELRPAETERLAILAEECAEVIQIVGKILRHGYASTHPDNEDGPDNQQMLEKEIGHVQSVIKMMCDEMDVFPDAIKQAKLKKLKTIKKYLHHQEEATK